MFRRLWSAEAGFFLGLWLVLPVVGRTSMYRDPGTFWHVVVGQRMVDSGEVICSDPFSFTRAAEPWTAHQWLAECGMGLLHRLGGWDALLLAAVTLLAAIYTFLASRMLRAGLHPLWAGSLLAVVLLASAPQFHVRPLLITIGLVACSFALLVDVDAGRRRLRRLWWFVPLMALWANLHGGALAGLGMFAVCSAWWIVLWLFGGNSPLTRRRDVLALLLIVAVSGAAVLLNPYGVELPRSWWTTLRMPLPVLIQEHAPLDLRDPLAWATVVLTLLYLATLLCVPPRRLRITWLLPLVWLVLAVARVRNVPLFAVTTAIVLAELIPQIRWADWLVQREVLLTPEVLAGRRCDARSAVIPLAVMLLVTVLLFAGVASPLVGPQWARFDPALWPVDLLPELEALDRTSPEGTPIFNDLNYGGFLIYHTPRLRVFADDRCALYGTEMLKDYEFARYASPSRINHWTMQYDFKHALVRTGTLFDRFLQNESRWLLVRRTPTATLYRREE